jgi:hypothetical protein
MDLHSKLRIYLFVCITWWLVCFKLQDLCCERCGDEHFLIFQLICIQSQFIYLYKELKFKRFQNCKLFYKVKNQASTYILLISSSVYWSCLLYTYYWKKLHYTDQKINKNQTSSFSRILVAKILLSNYVIKQKNQILYLRNSEFRISHNKKFITKYH